MSIIQFKEANCKNCYKCIRSCPVKAIAFKNEQAKIIEQDCILCGKCLTVCPQNAKTVKSDIDNVINYINNNEKVYVSLAPSFIAAFGDINHKQIYSALKKLGFTQAKETAEGAIQVSNQYQQLMKDKGTKNIITTACPSIVYLVEKYYPELISQLAPVVSPMIAHAKMLKEFYGSEIKVVFIGPCISKKEECKEPQTAGVVDAVITFEELESWMNSEGIDLTHELPEEDNVLSCSARIYPVPGGILNTIQSEYKRNYRCISIDGVDRCLQILDSISNDNVENYFIEMNSCSGGCIGGPCIKPIKGGFLEAREKLIKYFLGGSIKHNLLEHDSLEHDSEHDSLEHDSLEHRFFKNNSIKNDSLNNIKVDLSKRFVDQSMPNSIPSESTIQKILNSIGKFTKDKELNCGACGYSTCRDKAIAVYNNKAQVYMCLPYMREKAESISNLIINASPNAIFALDQELRIQEMNLSAQRMFSLTKESMKGKCLPEILQSEDFEKVLQTAQNIYDQKYFYDNYGLIVKQSIIYVPNHNTIVVIIQDISDEERKLQEIHKIRSANVDIAQKVIEKQMRVAQEIASLLGETTAETKVALTRLKNSIMAEMGEGK